MAAPRKYISEFGLHVQVTLAALLQQEDLSSVGEDSPDFHIYLIGRRPRISLDPASVKFNRETVTGRFFKHVRDQRFEIPFVAPHPYGRSDLTVRTSYPHTNVAFTTPDGVDCFTGKTALLLACCGRQYWEHLDLEVLYVGQSYGSDGSRSAVQRLQSHSTLQGIYAEALRKSPDQEVWLVLFAISGLLLTSFDGRTGHYQTTEAEDDAHLQTVLDSTVSEQVEVNFTEAALIKYFQPEFNVSYKDTFPSPGHSTYAQCNTIDLNAVSVEVPTEAIRLRLWSPAVAPSLVHFVTFPLHDESARRSMFEIP